MLELINKINKIQTKLKATKDLYNSFGKYSYRSCESILESVKPLLAETGLVLTITDEVVFVGNRYYIKATATITDGQNSISNSALAREPEEKKGQDEAQITGATSSYARKYALNGLFCIDDNKDADDTNTHGKDNDSFKKEVAVEKAKATKDLKKKVEEAKNTKEYALSRFESAVSLISKMKDLSPERDSSIMKGVQEVIAKLEEFGCSKEKEEFVKLVNEKMSASQDNDEITY